MKPLTQDALEDDLVFTLHQRGDAMTRSQASALIYFLHKKTFAQPYWQEVGRDSAPRWQKHRRAAGHAWRWQPSRRKWPLRSTAPGAGTG